MAASGELKEPGPSSVSNGSVVKRRKTGKFISQTQSEKSSSGTKLAEKGRKRMFHERNEDGLVGSPAPRKARRLRSVGHILFSRTFMRKLPRTWICKIGN